ncbi:hypothetical protein AWW66_25285 [Micromonospora rosaria]|uniref:Uncharacterized protein n=1 Tax=Micromonospora rosaria TaxID=47874 RepID=A0A136PLQ7_9ACTN|nr:hypothetical protein [Micromonospora rosaria]KXK59266.1 hypothetical protein AWW66_25285 [Micromonospora rosaria]
MTINRKAFVEEQAAQARAVSGVLARVPREFATAGELATLMAALPADTPVSIAWTVHVDPALAEGTPTVTAATARPVPLLTAELVDVAEDDGTVREYGRMVPGVELGAVVGADGQPVPDKTVPHQPYERALGALGVGDVDTTLAALAELVRWTADLLPDTPAGPDGTPETVAQRVTDPGIRARLGIEAARLGYSANRLTTLRHDLADREATPLRDDHDGNAR